MAGYYKMFRDYINNPIWQDDLMAWHVFEYFLGRCDIETGEWTIDYGTMSEFLKIPKSTLHGAIKRLKKSKMVNDIVNDKNTTFKIVNWKKYQHAERDAERKVNANRTQSEHIIRNKEYKNNTTNVVCGKPQDKRNPELQALIDYSDKIGFVLQGTLQENRFSAYNLLKKHGLAKSKKAVEYAIGVRGKPFAPSINDFTSLYRKLGDLINYYQREKNERSKDVIG